MLTRLITILKHNSLFMDVYNTREINRIARIFYEPDFHIIRTGPSTYKIEFSNRFGYRKPGYSPVFSYDDHTASWKTRIGKVSFESRTNPVFQLINELRGYTLLNTIVPGAYIIDAGASDGLASKYFAGLTGRKGKVLALEPDPTASLNDMPANVIHISACLAKKSGTVSLSLDTFGGSHLSEDGIPVTAYSLRDLIKKYRFSRVSFIKCDIEGAEVEIIKDIVDVVAEKKNCVVAIASYHRVNGKESWKILEKFAGKNPSIYTKTVYPYHATTYICNRANVTVMRKLQKLPAYNEIYDRVWSRGEN